jgi:putative flippase GtrA
MDGLQEIETTGADNGHGVRRRRGRFALITAAAAPANLAVYTGAVVAGIDPIAANLVSASVVSIPTFAVCRAWVWPDSGRVDRAQRAFKYWSTTIVNVLLATAALEVLDPASTLAKIIVPLAVYSVMTVARYIVLDRWVFDRAVSSGRGLGRV